MTEKEIKKEKDKANEEVKEIVENLKKDAPELTEGISALIGSGAGAAGSLATLGALGTAGFSAAGITSGLAAAGSIIGGGMLAGVGVLAAPVALLGIGGYAIAKKRKNARISAALGRAISKLFSIQERLMKNAEYFKEELAGIKVLVNQLEGEVPK